MKLLVPAPYVVLDKKAKKKATGTRKSARRLGVSDSSSDDSKTHSSREDEEEEEETSPPPAGEGKKRKAAPTREAGGSKKGKTLPPDYSTDADEGGEEWPLRPSPWRNRKYPDCRVIHSIPLLHNFSSCQI